jgi:nitrite reductase/ring-hydroxylating ferredoxin subunit
MAMSIEHDGEGCRETCACGASHDRQVTIGRREFVTAGVVALATAALAACSTGSDMTSPDALASTTLNLLDFPTLATVGGITTTTIDQVPIAIFHTSNENFVALSRICPHQGSTINVTNSGFLCPNHGATFNTSGTWVGGQRTSNLRSYPVVYDADAGTITVGS